MSILGLNQEPEIGFGKFNLIYPTVQKQIKWALDDYEILIAAEREAAITQLRRHEPAVVLLDLGLPPDVDGATDGVQAHER